MDAADGLEWSDGELLYGAGENWDVLPTHVSGWQQSAGGVQAHPRALSDYSRRLQADKISEWIVCELLKAG